MLNRDVAGNIEGRHMFLYMLQSLALAVGLLLYPFIRQTLGISGKAIKALSATAGVIYSVCILSAGYIDNYTGITAIMILIPITMGYLVGMVYVLFTRKMHDSSLMGRTFGTALGISIILQFLIQIRWNIGRMLAPLMCIMCVSMIVWDYKTANDWQDDNRAEGKLSVFGFRPS